MKLPQLVKADNILNSTVLGQHQQHQQLQSCQCPTGAKQMAMVLSHCSVMPSIVSLTGQLVSWWAKQVQGSSNLGNAQTCFM